MKVKRHRPTAEHLMIVFEEYRGKAIHGTDINRAMIAKDLFTMVHRDVVMFFWSPSLALFHSTPQFIFIKITYDLTIQYFIKTEW